MPFGMSEGEKCPPVFHSSHFLFAPRWKERSGRWPCIWPYVLVHSTMGQSNSGRLQAITGDSTNADDSTRVLGTDSKLLPVPAVCDAFLSLRGDVRLLVVACCPHPKRKLSFAGEPLQCTDDEEDANDDDDDEASKTHEDNVDDDDGNGADAGRRQRRQCLLVSCWLTLAAGTQRVSQYWHSLDYAHGCAASRLTHAYRTTGTAGTPYFA